MSPTSKPSGVESATLKGAPPNKLGHARIFLPDTGFTHVEHRRNVTVLFAVGELDGTKQGDLAAWLGVTQPSVSRTTLRRRQGLTLRGPDNAEGNRWTFTLTPDKKTLVSKCRTVLGTCIGIGRCAVAGHGDDDVVLGQVGSPVAGLSQRIGPRLPMTVGPLLVAVGLALMTRVASGQGYVSVVLPAVLVFGNALVITVAPLNVTVLATVEDGRAGVGFGHQYGGSGGVAAGHRRTAGLVRYCWISW